MSDSGAWRVSRAVLLLASSRPLLSFPAGSSPDCIAFVGASLGEPGSPKARPRSLHLPAEVLFDLEEVLNEPRFMGVPIGSTLGDVIRTVFAG